jgi:hypothetical protein
MPKRLINNGTSWLWILLLVTLVLSGSGIALRMGNEANNQAILTTVDYKEFARTANTANMNIDQVMARLQAAGVNTVALNEVTLRDLAYNGDLYISSYGDLEALTRTMDPTTWAAAEKAIGSTSISPSNLAVVTDKPATAAFLRERLGARFLPSELISFDIAGKSYFIINAQLNPINVENYLAVKDKAVSQDLDARLGFDETLIARLQAQGFSIILRPGLNPGSNTQYQAEYERLVSQYNIRYLIFAGNDLPGAPDHLDWLEAMINRHGMIVGIIEAPTQLGYVAQNGLDPVMKATGYQVNRVYSSTNDEFVTSIDERNYRWVRAVIDRGIRILYVVPFKDQKLSYAQNLNNTVDMLANFHTTMAAKGFAMNQPLNDLSGKIPGPWHRLMVCLSLFLATTIYLLYLFRPRLKPAWLAAWLGVGLLGAAGANLVMHTDFSMLYALGAAILYPTLSGLVLLLYLKKYRERPLWEQILISLAILLGINGLGMYTLATIMADIRYMMNVIYFTGVKLSFLVPLALFLVSYVSVMVGWADFKAKAVRFLLDKPNYLVLLLLIVGGGAGYYYLGRSGNAVVSVSGLEIKLREVLEKLFLARPRFKELLIGYPALFVMVYWYKKFKQDLLLLVLGLGVMAGSISMIDTFCHDFASVMISTNRTLGGLLCGILIGLGCLLVIKAGEWLHAKLNLE